MRWVLRYHFQLSLDLFDFIPDFPRALNLPSDSRCILLGSVTRTRNSEVRHEISNVGGSFVFNLYIIHFIDKVCWTSQILGEKSWKKCDMFLLWVLLQTTKTRRRRPVHQNKQQNVTFFSRFFSKDLWSSANFVNEMDNIKVDQHKILDNFHL